MSCHIATGSAIQTNGKMQEQNFSLFLCPDVCRHWFVWHFWLRRDVTAIINQSLIHSKCVCATTGKIFDITNIIISKHCDTFIFTFFNSQNSPTHVVSLKKATKYLTQHFTLHLRYGEIITSSQFCYLSSVPEGGSHDNRLVAKFLVIIVYRCN